MKRCYVSARTNPSVFALVAALICVAAAAVAGEARWPQFRGVGAAGVGTGILPTHFGPESNVLWKTAVPGGHSSPCIWNDHIFLTGFNDGQLQVLSLNRSTGSVLWKRTLQPGTIERGAQLSNPSTGTPAMDGESVFVYFGSFGLAAFDFNGSEKWRKPLSVPVTQHGAGTSPVLKSPSRLNATPAQPSANRNLRSTSVG